MSLDLWVCKRVVEEIRKKHADECLSLETISSEPAKLDGMTSHLLMHSSLEPVRTEKAQQDEEVNDQFFVGV